LWAERFDRELADIFAVQDEVTRHIVTSIAPLLASEALQLAKRKRPEDMQAYDLYLKAKALIDHAQSTEDLREGRKLCNRAIALDPSFARAHAYKAFSYTIEMWTMDVDDLTEWRKQALPCAEQAVALDAMDGVSHWALAEATFLLSQYDRSLSHITRAVALNPNDADVLVMSSWIHAARGNLQLGLQHMEMAVERNPSNPPWYHWIRGALLSMSGRYDDALAAFTLYGQPNADLHRWRTVTLVQLGRIDEARTEMQAFVSLRPKMTSRAAQKYLAYLPNVENYIDALRQAGLPE
jgi:adenylate cyclase